MNSTFNADILMRQAARFLKQGRPKEAQQVINQVLRAGVSSGAAWDIYAQSCANLNQIQPAILALKKAISLHGGRLDRALLLGELLVRAQQWQEAANIYQQVIRQDDSQAKAWFGLGESLLGTQDVERAIRCFSGALERQSDFAEARQRLAVCFLERGEPFKTLRLLETLMEEFPEAAGPKVDYGEALRQANRYRQAQEVLEPLLDDPVVGQAACSRLADVCLHIGEYERAETLLERLDEHHKHEVGWIMKRVRLDNIYGLNDQACQRLSELLEREPGIANGWKQLMDLTRQPLNAQQLNSIKEQARLASQLGRQEVAADFQFALALHYELDGDLDREFKALEKGNSLKDGLVTFNFDKYLTRMLPSRDCYNANSIRDWSVAKEEQHGLAPILILSLPRSGSTLVEQILGAHSNTEATGEADFAEQAWYALTGERSMFVSADTHRAMCSKKVKQFRDYYLQAVADAGFSSEKRVINKGINTHKFEL